MSDSQPTNPNAETVKLLPCPACGVIPEVCRDKYWDSKYDQYWVSCRNKECPFETCDGRIERTKDAAIAAWNTRHESDELKQLRKIEAAAKNAVRCYDERDVISQSVVEYLRDAMKGESK